MDGGGIDNLGTLILNNSIVTDNVAADGSGGGISNSGTATLTNSTVSGNTASSSGGGIFNFGGTLTLTDSTVSGNTATSFGGGIGNFGGGTATISDSTVSGNTAAVGLGGGIFNDFVSTATLTNSTVSANIGSNGGGIFASGTLTLTNSTVSANTAPDFGGGILNNVGTAALKNTIVANNTAAIGNDCSGMINSNGYNLASDGTCNLTGPGDLPNTNPNLGPLADNGGPTFTHALLPGSPAIDAGSPDCPPPATDQRGIARPLDGDGDGSAICDMGAFECDEFDADLDAVGNACDNCPAWPNAGQALPPWPVTLDGSDPDCDGWSTSLENIIGTLPLVACAATPAEDDEPVDASPADFDDNQFVNIFDVNAMRPPVFNLLLGKNTDPPNPDYGVRFDLNADDFVNIFDVNALRPPIFNLIVPCTP